MCTLDQTLWLRILKSFWTKTAWSGRKFRGSAYLWSIRAQHLHSFKGAGRHPRRRFSRNTEAYVGSCYNEVHHHTFLSGVWRCLTNPVYSSNSTPKNVVHVIPRSAIRVRRVVVNVSVLWWLVEIDERSRRSILRALCSDRGGKLDLYPLVIVRPHHSRSTTYVDAAYGYRPSCAVCLSVTLVCPAKTAEPIEMPFGLKTRMGQRNHVLDGGPDPHGKQ